MSEGVWVQEDPNTLRSWQGAGERRQPGAAAAEQAAIEPADPNRPPRMHVHVLHLHRRMHSP